jgi:hypothetical protein
MEQAGRVQLTLQLALPSRSRSRPSGESPEGIKDGEENIQRKLVATMDRRQFQAALDRVGLDPSTTAGPALGLSRRQVYRLIPAENKVPEPLAELLRLMIKLDIRLEELPRSQNFMPLPWTQQNEAGGHAD